MTQQKLVFGARARRSQRRARIRARLGLAAWITSAVAAGGGVATQAEETPESALQGAVSLQGAFVVPVSAPEPGSASAPGPSLRGPRNPSGGGRSSPNNRPQTNPIEDAIGAAASEFGIDGDYLRSLARCESALDPNAYSSAGYYGLFQFDEETWSEYGYGSIWDPVAQARTAARLLAMGEDDRWPNCA